MAAFGSIGLENVWGILNQYVSVERAVKLLTAARMRFGIPAAPIAVGTLADLTLFTPEDEWIFEEKDILSFSKKSALIGTQMKGRVKGIIAQKQLILNEKE